jgi:hypothetical protein
MIFLNPNQFDKAIEFFVETIFPHLLSLMHNVFISWLNLHS